MSVRQRLSVHRDRLRKTYQLWLDRRIPRAAHVTLSQRSLFILPTAPGYVWLVVSLMVFLLAVNYRNSLAFGLCFFMLSLFMLSILHTWRNLGGLTLVARGAGQGHAGQDILLTIELRAGRRAREAIQLGWPGSESAFVHLSKSKEQMLPVKAFSRGWLDPGRIRVESTYPLGLCRAWSWVSLDIAALVFPRPDFSYPLPVRTGDGEQSVVTSSLGHEDFAGFRRYRNTDLSAHIDWKGYARSGEMNTKLFERPTGNEMMLQLSNALGQDLEEKLSVLTGWCLKCERNGQPYGLDLPGNRFSPALGAGHLEACLSALALYDLGTISQENAL